MRILLVGLPKSGTTILTYRIAEALDGAVIEFEPVAGPDEGLPADHRHVVTKKLLGTQTTDMAPYRHYDRKVWICRDPRDFLVSQSLYRWHREAPPEPVDQVWFDRVIEKLVAKEIDPGSVSFLDLEPANYFETLDAVADLWRREADDGWFLFRYEDMIDGHYEALNRYLGFEIEPSAEVADGLSRVVRTKGYGDWRDWFTPPDVEFYASGGLQRYMEAFGYESSDWRLNQPQRIEPAHCSQYVTALFNDYELPASDATGSGTGQETRPGIRLRMDETGGRIARLSEVARSPSRWFRLMQRRARPRGSGSPIRRRSVRPSR